MGKFGKFIVHDWYINERQKTESIETELKNVQQFEEELMQEALGLKPKDLLLRKKDWTEESFQQFVEADKKKKFRGDDKDGGVRDGIGKVGGGRDENDEKWLAQFASTEETKGLGFAPHRTAKLEAFKAETLGVTGELAGVNAHIRTKQELDIDAKMKYCGSSSSTGSSEPVIKKEIKEEPVKAESQSSGSGGAALKDEVKQEQDDAQTQRDLERLKKMEKKEKKEKKKDKKKDKKDKKKSKKMKKKAKELKKISQEIAKLKKKRKERGDSDSSSSSSSS